MEANLYIRPLRFSNLIVAQVTSVARKPLPVKFLDRMRKEARVFKIAHVPYTKEQLENIFKSHDADGDGKLSQNDLKAAFQYLGSRWASYRAKQALRHADSDDDGAVEKEELEKLIGYALQCGYTIA